MKMIDVSVQNWEKYRHPIIQFVKRYDKQNRELYRWIFQLRKHKLSQPGTKIKLALWDGKIIALYAFLNYGTTESIFLISPNYEQTHIGTSILKDIISDLGVCYLCLPYSQPTLLKIALNAGMVAFAYTTQEQGMKLWLGGGQWNINDISEKEALSP